jgi:hypothetical protein
MNTGLSVFKGGTSGTKATQNTQSPYAGAACILSGGLQAQQTTQPHRIPPHPPAGLLEKEEDNNLEKKRTKL